MTKRLHASPSPSKGSVNTAFSRAASTSEVEIKFLVPNNRIEVFDNIENYFLTKGWIHSANKNYHLLTRQLDTGDRALGQKGTSLRLRGNCLNGDLNHVLSSDICLKTGKTQDASGAIRRGEYEARTNSFNVPDIDALKKQFPADEFPELHEALEGLSDGDLREFFRIDDIRHRFVVELPESVTKLKGKRYVSELILDDVMFVLDVPGLDEPLFLGRDLEIEAETLFKPCSYDNNPEAAKNISSKMSRKQTDRAMRAMLKEIRKAAGLPLELNVLSKAERGFIALDQTMNVLQDFIRQYQKDADAPKNSNITFNFNGKALPSNDNDNLRAAALASRAMPDRLGSASRGRPIARYISAP